LRVTGYYRVQVFAEETMRRWMGSFGLLTALLLVAAAGCGDDDDGPPCREVCGGSKPFCGPYGECVECWDNFDCANGEFCGDDYKCHG
jgi:hypothetical protein